MEIKLNDLLNLDSKDIEDGRITFNTGYDGQRHIDNWLRRRDDEDKNGSDFSFYSRNTAGKQKLYKGELVIVAVQLYSSDMWLLTCISRVTKINEGAPCEREGIDKYRKFFGRVIFRMKKSAQGYNFKIRTFLDRCDVVEILPKVFGGLPFPGYNNVCIKMRDLINFIENTKLGEDWKAYLKAVKAVYCLNNHDEKKAYIGSAYNNEDCLLGRWQDYFDSYTGGNVELKKLFKNKNGDYFLNNFYFSILEVFPTNVDKNKIIDREHYWMNVFNSRDERCGYNKN